MDIKDLMTAEEKVLTELNDILDYEREVLIKDKGAELKEIVQKKTELAKKISVIEAKRKEIYGNKKASELINDGLVTKELVDRLKKLSMDAKEKGEVNLILTRQSIYYIRMITSALNPTPRVMTYGNSGEMDDKTSSNIFNTRG